MKRRNGQALKRRGAPAPILVGGSYRQSRNVRFAKSPIRFFATLWLCLDVFLAIVSSFAFAAGLPKVSAPAMITIAGEHVTLGALLKMQPADSLLAAKFSTTLLTSTPTPGQTKTVNGSDILRRLEALGVTPARFAIAIPNEVVISRQSQAVTPGDIAAQVSQQFLPTLGWKDAQLEKIDVVEDILLPAGEVEWRFQCSPHTDFARPFYLNINFAVRGEVVKRAFLRTVLSIHETVAVAAVELKTSQPVAENDIRWERQRLLSTQQRPLKDISFLRSRRPRMTILPGRVLTEDLFLSVPLVKRGDNVVLVYESDRVRLKAQAKSLAAGQLGQRIQVMNPDSGKVLLAEVTDVGTARVVF